MNQSENINELASALAKAQGEMQAAIKDSVNPFFKSKYADLGSVWDAARPVLSKNGLCVIQSTEMIGEKIVMVTTLAHSSGQWMKSFLPLNPAKNDSQSVGAAITYLRRYSLSALVGVVCDDDDDGETDVGRGKAQTPSANINKKPETIVIERIDENEVKTISTLLEKLDKDSKKSFYVSISTFYKASNLEELPKTAFKKCMVSLNAKVDQLKEQKTMVA